MTVISDAMEIWGSHAIIREGKWNKVYLDSIGRLTAGIGHLVTKADNLKLGDIVSNAWIEETFQADSNAALLTSLRQWEEVNILTSEWLAALISVNFQLGDFSVKFKNSYKLLKQGRYSEVTDNLRASLWFKQTPVRVEDFITAIQALPPRKVMV